MLAWRHSYGRDAALRTAAEEATRQLSPRLLEVIVERGERPSDDMISWLWSAGRAVFDDWSADDVLANTTFLFEAGSETTSMLICSMTRRLLWETSERRRAILADDEAIRWFMEEVLRHSTVVHWRARRATQDVELGGVTITAGDMVHPVNGAANRDPDYWERPDEFDPGRPRLASHLAFNVGPRHCAGAHLARLQAVETVRGALARVPGPRARRGRPATDLRGLRDAHLPAAPHPIRDAYRGGRALGGAHRLTRPPGPPTCHDSLHAHEDTHEGL